MVDGIFKSYRERKPPNRGSSESPISIISPEHIISIFYFCVQKGLSCSAYQSIQSTPVYQHTVYRILGYRMQDRIQYAGYQDKAYSIQDTRIQNTGQNTVCRILGYSIPSIQDTRIHNTGQNTVCRILGYSIQYTGYQDTEYRIEYRIQDTRIQITGYIILGYSIQGTGYRILGYSIQDTGYQDTAYRIQDTRIQHTGYRIKYTGYQDTVYRKQGTGYIDSRIKYSGHRIQDTRTSLQATVYMILGYSILDYTVYSIPDTRISILAYFDTVYHYNYLDFFHAF